MSKATVTRAAPAPLPGAVQSWRKTLIAVDDLHGGEAAIQGQPLEDGIVYELPEQGLIVGYDHQATWGDTHTITVWKIREHSHVLLKRIGRKGREWAGPATLRALAGLVYRNPWPAGTTAVAVSPTPNPRLDDDVARPAAGQPERSDRAGLLIQAVRGAQPLPQPQVDAAARSDADVAGSGATGAGPADGLPAGGYSGPTWEIAHGRPGRLDRRPTSGYTLGVPFRATLLEEQHHVPTDAPGYGRLDEDEPLNDVQRAWLATQKSTPRIGRVTAIVVAVAEEQPVFCREEDGNNPPDLFGRDGWYFRAHVRPATRAEAEGVLAAERLQADREELARQLRELLSGKYTLADDATVPAHGAAAHVLDLPEVPLSDGPPRWDADRVHVDRQAEVLWTVHASGPEGMDGWWENLPGRRAAAHPLTPERARLVEALYAAYDNPADWESDGYDPQAVAILRAGGWTRQSLGAALPGLTAHRADDATALQARTTSQWREAGWGHGHRPTPAGDAGRLADAGITAGRADQLRKAGHTTVEQMLHARAPLLPTTPGRFVIPGPTPSSAAFAADPRAAQGLLERRPEAWASWQHRPGVTCVHATGAWQFWSDCGITRGYFAGPAPEPVLSDSAVRLLGVVAAAANALGIHRPARAMLAAAVRHDSATVDTWSTGPDDGGYVELTLSRHVGTLADGQTLTVWAVTSAHGGPSGGGHHEAALTSWAYLEERQARASFAGLRKRA